MRRVGPVATPPSSVVMHPDQRQVQLPLQTRNAGQPLGHVAGVVFVGVVTNYLVRPFRGLFADYGAARWGLLA